MKLDPLDKLFSEFIRRRAVQRVNGCERCLHYKSDYKQLQCSHYHGRSKKSVRWDEDNAAGLCGACHMYSSAHPLEHTEWFKARLGDSFDALNIRARTPQKPDKELLKLYFERKIKEVENETCWLEEPI